MKKILRGLQGGDTKNEEVKVNAETSSTIQASLEEFEREPFLVKLGPNIDSFCEKNTVSC
jgi:hypothetical protein